MESFVPKKVFLTKGVGRHKEKLASFEEALRDADKLDIIDIVLRCKALDGFRALP